MDKKTGIWIDHRQAVIITLDKNQEAVDVVESETERPPKMEGGSRSKVPWGPRDVGAETRNERKFQQQLDRYYQEIASNLKGVESIFLFGPGQAKGELKKHLDDTHGLRDRVVAVETADKMTQPQMVAKVREFYVSR